MVTHPAFAGTSLKFQPLALGALHLFQKAWEDLFISPVKTHTLFFLNKCKLVFRGYHQADYNPSVDSTTEKQTSLLL